MRKKNTIFILGLLGLTYILVLFITTGGFQKWHFSNLRSTDEATKVPSYVGRGGNKSSAVKLDRETRSYSLSSSYLVLSPSERPNFSGYQTGDGLFVTSSGIQRSYGDNNGVMLQKETTAAVIHPQSSLSNSSLTLSMPLIAQVGQYHSPIHRAFSNEPPLPIRGKQTIVQQRTAKTSSGDWSSTDENPGDPLPIGTPTLPLLIITVVYGAICSRRK